LYLPNKFNSAEKTWMRGSSPRMTERVWLAVGPSSFETRLCRSLRHEGVTSVRHCERERSNPSGGEDGLPRRFAPRNDGKYLLTSPLRGGRRAKRSGWGAVNFRAHRVRFVRP